MAAAKSRANGRSAEPTVDVEALRELYKTLPGGDATTDEADSTFALTATLLIRSARLISARVEDVVAPLGLSVPKFEVLGLLHAAPGGEMSFAELKRTMFMHPATMGHTIRLLEADGLIKRRAHDGDRRAYVAVITAQGRAVTSKGVQALREIHFGCAGLSVTAAKTIGGRLSALG